MSDKPYEKECNFCKTKIMMSKESGKWLPYDLNNGPHHCRGMVYHKQENGSENVKVATIDGLAALDLIPHLGKGLVMNEGEIRGQKVVEVFIEK